MNPLLNRLFEDRSKNKSRKKSLLREQPNHSAEVTLVPKIPVKLRLQSLPEVQTDKKISNAARVYIGKLPSISFKAQQKDVARNRTTFRERKLSTSIRQIEGNFFSTELQMAYNPTLGDQMSQQSPSRRIKIETSYERQVVSKQPTEDELFQYLKVLEDNSDLNEQFCYMNRGDMPYSFHIVEYQKRKKDEYLTVSLRGISYYKQDQNEFYTIRKFRKQIELYKRVKQIDFFRNYLLSKTLQHWKDCMVRTKFKMKCKHVMSHLFSQNLILQQYLHFLHNLAEDYSGGNFFNFKFTATKSLAQFLSEAEQGNKGLIKSIKKFDNLIQKTLKTTIQNILTKFRSEERVTLGTGDQKRQQAYLPFDAKRRSMKYTQMAKLKQFEGMMFRLIKYTDLVIFTVKTNLARKCYQNSIAELKNLKVSYENKESIRFTNWIDVQVTLKNQNGQGVIVCQPTFQQVSQSVLSIKDNFLKHFFRDHRLLIEKSQQQFYCENIQSTLQEEHPTKLQLKYFILKNTQFEELNGQFQQSLQTIFNDIDKHMDGYRKGMLAVYNQNLKYSKVSDCMTNQLIKSYLASYRQNQKMIRESEETVQFALVAIKIKNMKEVIRKNAEQKYKLISNYVPTEIISRCNVLYNEENYVYTVLKENPYNIEEYIKFERNYRQCKQKMVNIEVLIQQLLEFEDVVYRNGIRIGEQPKLAINQKQFFFQGLIKRLEQLQSIEQEQRKKFQTSVQDLIPIIQSKSQQLLKQLFEDDLINSHSSKVPQVQQKLKWYIQSFSKLQSKASDLFRYQNQLRLGHKILQQYEKLKISILSFNKIWEERDYYFKVQNIIKVTGYGSMSQVDLQPLLQFVNNMESYSSILECFQLLQEFKQQISKLLKIVKISQLISTNTLQEEHISRLKKIIVHPSNSFTIDYLFSKEGKKTITCERLYLQSNVQQIEYEISEIVFQSAQESIVKVQLGEVQQFWKKAKIKLISEDIAENQVPILHLDFNEQFHEKIGYFMIMLKNIQGSPHIMIFSRQKAIQNIKTCTYLRSFLTKWEEVERQWIKLLPLMTNCPAVKHQSNVFFEFTSVDTNLKKLIKNVSQMSTLRKLCEDVEDKKYFNTVNNCAEQLQSINKVFNNFLENKRSTYGRFNFLSDNQLINVIQYVKDAKSASKFVKYCFNCDELQLDNQLVSGFQNKSEVFKLRKAIIRGEVDEIFKSIEDNMKNSMKFMIRAMLPKLKISQDIDQQIKQYPAQVTLVVDRLFWTEMSENYLNTTTYSEYKLVLKKIQEDMVQLLLSVQEGLWYKLSIRLMQMISLKEVGFELVRDQITVNDFKWKEQLRFYPYEQDLTICQFDSKIKYGCQYYPPSYINVPTLNTTRFLYESFYCCVNNKGLIVKGDQGEGKKMLIYEAGVFFGSYQKKVICNSKLSAHFVNKFVQGALAAGAWLSFYEFDSLNFAVCAQLLDLVGKANRIQNPLQSMFLLVHHGKEVQQISIYSFHNFTVFEPDHQRICFHLLQVYKFKEYSQISIKLIRFFKLIRPFLDRIMGSRLCLLRKVIQKAGTKRLSSQIGVNQNLLIAEAIKEQIISKERQSAFQALTQALAAYFDTKYQPSHVDSKYTQKLQNLTKMIASQTKNIIVLGQRSCKSTIISQALSNLHKQKVYLFGETNQTFFTSQTMQFLRFVPSSTVFIYDSNKVISEWRNLITSGYLLMEGKRVILQNQTIMELRDISGCSPSFVGQCHIIYIGQYLVSNLQKFAKHFGQQNPNFSPLSGILKQLYGELLQNIDNNNLHIITQYLRNIKQALPAKSLHRLVVWLLSLIDKQSIWTRHFGGKYTEFCINPYSYELGSIDTSRCEQQSHPAFSSYIITPTKSSILVIDAINAFANSNIFVHLAGAPQTGKSCLLELLSKKVFLKFNQSPQQWGQQLKKMYCNVRRERKNILVDIEKQGHKIVIDDLDMSSEHHFQSLRVLMETSSFRDQYFNEYFIQKYQLICCSRQLDKTGKYWSSVCNLSLKQFNKQSLQTITRINFAKQISQYSMNRQAQQLINGNILKFILILQDDLTNIIGNNAASSLLTSLVRNLLSLPKKQAYISASEYIRFFKSHLYFKIHEKSENGKLKWQIQSVYQNLLKVILGEIYQQSNQYYCNLEGQFQNKKKEELQNIMLKIYPNLICFDSLVKNTVYLINQFSCMDRNIIILGRLGTGKKLLLHICGQLMNLNVIQNLSDAIIAALHNETSILRNILQDSLTFYEQLHNCDSDKDLAKLVKIEKREQYYKQAAGEESGENKILNKCKKLIIHAFIAQKKENYQSFCRRRRQIQNLPICLVEEWPPEAILTMYKIKDPYPNMHAQIFITINKIMTNNNIPKFSLKFFEKYLKLYSQIFEKIDADVQEKLQLNYKIHFKFKQSCELIGIWESRVDILRTEIEHSIKKAKKTIMVNQLYYFALSIFHKQIKDEQQKFAEETEQFKQMNEDIDRRMTIMKNVMSRLQKIVSSFQRTELSELKKIYKQNRLIYFGVQCLCLLLGEETEEKAINRLLADPNLLMKMKDSQLLVHRNPKLQTKIGKELPTLQNQLKTSSSELAKTLVEWVKGIVDYWQINHEYKIEHEKQIKASINLQKSGERHKELMRQVESINKSVIQKQARIAQYEKIKRQQQFQLNSIGQRLINASKILPILTNQHQQTKSTIQSLTTYRQNLRGNSILTAITAIILTLQPLKMKHIILNSTKNILKKNLVSFSEKFMAEISGRKINSLQSLNYYLLTCNNLAKVVFDPRRKFLNFIQKYAPIEMRETIIENCEELSKFEPGKIYQTSSNIKIDKSEQLMMIDWGSVALEEKETIFLSIAENKRPEYFQAKNELEIQITRNLKVLAKLKQQLYSKICERQMKIIDDLEFIQNSIELEKIKENTSVLKTQAQQKIAQIDDLTKQINEQATQIIHIYQTLKHFRKIDLELMLYTYCKGDTIQHFFSWTLTNISPQNRTVFIILLIIRIKNQALFQLLRDIIHQNPLKQVETKSKKPQGVSLKNWQIVVRLSAHSPNLKKMMQNIQKQQKEFEQWCADAGNYVLPACLSVENIEFIEYLAIVAYIKPKMLSYCLTQLISQYMPYSINMLGNKQIIQKANQKYPVVIQGQIDWLIRVCRQQNEGRFKLHRVTKINGQVQMKNLIWRSMQAKQWMILYDIENAKTVQMLENICYYVMNYDRQQGFKIFIVIDSLSQPEAVTTQQSLIKSSVFLESVSIYLYEEQISCDRLLKLNSIQYQIAEDQNSRFSSKHIFNRIYKAIVICYSALVNKYPQLRKIDFNRFTSILKYIKNKNISVEFNAFTIVQYFSKIMSYAADSGEIRGNIEQIWDLIVDENKVAEKAILGIPLNEQSYDKFIKRNHILIGCEHSYFVRESQWKLQPILSKIAKIYNLEGNKEQIFSFMRIQLGKLPIALTGTNSQNLFSYFYNKEVRLHNNSVEGLKNILDQLNEQNERQIYLEVSSQSEYIRVMKLFSKLTHIFKTEVNLINFKGEVINFINKLRKSHDFLLYFNHSLPILLINPTIVTHLQAFISTYLINQIKKQEIKDGYNYLSFLDFMNSRQEKDLHLLPGLYLHNLNSQQFMYNKQAKTLDPSFQVDGIEPAPIIGVKLKQSKIEEEKQQIQIQIFRRGEKILSSATEVSAVYSQWNLRNPKLIAQ